MFIKFPFHFQNKIVHGGAGGDGGNVYKFGKIVLFKDIEYPVQIAESNDKDGTAITIRGKKYTLKFPFHFQELEYA